VTLLYRAVWQDSGLNATSALDEEFRRWCGTKGFDVSQIPERGTASTPGGKTAQIRRIESDSARAILCTLREEDGVRTWTTTATAMSAGGSQTFWIDLECVDESNQRMDIAAPRLVRALLTERGVAPTYAGENVKPVVTVVGPKECRALAERLTDRGRRRPIVVFSPDRSGGPGLTHDRAVKTATDTAGVAAVFVLMPDAERELQQFLPEGFWVYGGAVRLYLPGLDAGNIADAVRHQVVSRRVIEVHPRRAASIMARRIAQSEVHPSVPVEWGLIQTSLRRPSEEEIRGRVGELEIQKRDESELLELLAVAELEVKEKDLFIAALERRVGLLEDQHIDDVAEIEELQREQRSLKRMLKEMLDPRVGNETQSVRPEDLDVPSSVLDAIEQARESLPFLEIPKSAERDIDNLDEGYKGRVWGEGVWEGLLALNSYAADKAAGKPVHGLHDWCERTGAWPKNKLSMIESDTVLQDAKLRGQRRFKVSTAVEADGFVIMVSHLKIQVGGGNNIPRVYFHDDTDGATGKFHIGFVGPHYLVENTKS
jgi:hypothetical protein